MDVLQRIRHQLHRLDAAQMHISLDAEFEPAAGDLLRIDYAEAYWHLLPTDFEGLCKSLPDGAGPERVREAIESDAIHVWHGPSPKDSRDE